MEQARVHLLGERLDQSQAALAICRTVKSDATDHRVVELVRGERLDKPGLDILTRLRGAREDVEVEDLAAQVELGVRRRRLRRLEDGGHRDCRVRDMRVRVGPHVELKTDARESDSDA